MFCCIFQCPASHSLSSCCPNGIRGTTGTPGGLCHCRTTCCPELRCISDDPHCRPVRLRHAYSSRGRCECHQIIFISLGSYRIFRIDPVISKVGMIHRRTGVSQYTLHGMIAISKTTLCRLCKAINIQPKPQLSVSITYGVINIVIYNI